MSLYSIASELSKKEQAVFTSNEVSRIGSISKASTSVYINRLLKKKLLFRVEKNKVSTTDDPFIVASQITAPAYLSLTTALYLHNAIQQIVDTLFVMTPRQKKSQEIFGMKTTFVKVSPLRMFGYSKVRKGNSFVMVADIERAILDCLSFQRYCSLQYLCDAFRMASIKKLETYTLTLKTESVTRRVGYMLDILSIPHHLKRGTNVIHKLNSRKNKKGLFNKKWYLYVNEDVLC